MKRLIVTGPRQVEFEDVPEPECPTDGILVKAKVTAISQGTEIRVYRAVPVDEAGQFLHERIPFQLPAENGYSMVGDVKEVGRDVKDYSKGDRVFVPCSHKQYAAVSAKLAVKLP
ncbi:MAG: alcohol dehydrogenase catalytic domain-containing protein, partial [Planctomycetes bacterium]|nr:alcohol dehydrogenase catalytic domain-containing protein [Planctomycetota bacterium]